MSPFQRQWTNSHDLIWSFYSFQAFTQTLNKTTCECGCITCEVGQYRCGNGQCIPQALRCDGIIDCIDDEIGCGKSSRVRTGLKST